MTQRGKFRRVIAAVQRPRTTLSLAFLLAGIGVAGWWGAKSTELFGWSQLPVSRPWQPPRTVTLATQYANDRERGLRIIDLETESADELARIASTEQHRLLTLTFSSRWYRSSLVVPWREVSFLKFMAQTSDGQSAPSDLAEQMRRMYSARVPGFLLLELAGPDVPARSSKNEILWVGVVVNAVFIAGVVVWAVSLAWIPRWPAARRAAFLARDICPACRYSLAGVASNDGSRRCPECGITWPAPERPGTSDAQLVTRA